MTERQAKVLDAAKAIARRGHIPTLGLIARDTGLPYTTVAGCRKALRKLSPSPWIWPNEKPGGRGNLLAWGLDRIDRKILRAARALEEEGTHPSCKAVARLTRVPLGTVNRRVNRLRSWDKWPHEVRRCNHQLPPDMRAEILEMARRPNTSTYGVARAVSRKYGRAIHRTTVAKILANPVPRRVPVMAPTTEAEVWRLAAAVRAGRAYA